MVNIVLIIIDTLRYDYSLSMGALNNLRARGMDFAHMYTPSTFTFANMCAIRTGMYPPRHNWRTWPDGGPLKKTKMLEDYLRESGYNVLTTLEVPYDPPNTLRQLDKGLPRSPYFLYLHYNGIHDNIFLGRFKKSGIPMSVYQEQVGRANKWLAETLKKFDLDNTLLIVIGDHGVGLAPDKMVNEGLDVGAGQVYNFRVRVPCVITGPGIRKKKIENAHSLIDIMPTILDYLGIGMQGISMLRQRDLVYLEAQSPHSIWPSKEPNVFGCTDGKTKVMLTPVGKRLYDDPEEKLDVISLDPDGDWSVLRDRVLFIDGVKNG